MAIHRLSKAASSAIVSTSMVQSQLSVVKELLENAIDAIGNNCSDFGVSGGKIHNIQIEIDKDSAGLEYLAVRDDGCGVGKEDRAMMCLNYTSSKLHSVDDLTNGVNTCGFRGEALNLIAKLSKTMLISTRTASESMVATWSVNPSGVVINEPKLTSGLQGTMVKVYGLFKETPVRHKFLLSNKAKYIREIESLVVKYALIYPAIRFQIKYVKALPHKKFINYDVVSYNSKMSRDQFMCQVLHIKAKSWLTDKKLQFCVGDPSRNGFTVNVDVTLPKMRAIDIPNIKNGLKVLTVNNRPLDLSLKFGKEFSKIVGDVYLMNQLLAPNVWYIGLEIPTNKIDVNIEPEKSDIIIVNENGFFAELRKVISTAIREIHEIESKMPDQTSETTNNENAGDINAQDDNPQIDMNFILDDDESFIKELDSTIDKLKEKHTQNILENTMSMSNETFTSPIDGNSGHKNNTLKAQTIESNILEPEPSQKPQNDQNRDIDNDENIDELENDWSRTIYDTTGVSSELDIPTSSLHSSQNIENIDPSHITISNPWTNSKLSHEIHNSKNDSDTTLTIKEISSEPKKRLKLQDMIPLGNIHSKQSVSGSKQMKILSYGTYTVDELPKRKKLRTNETILPKITHISQDLFNEITSTEYKQTLDIINRKRLLHDDEMWLSRSGIPSEHIVTGAISLYAKVEHCLENEHPTMNKINLYQLK